MLRERPNMSELPTLSCGEKIHCYEVFPTQ